MQLFTQTFQNIISNYIPHETITCGDRNPPWIDQKIKKLILHKNCAFNTSFRDKNYYSCLSNKLLDSKTSPKLYWSILKTFLNNKKIPCIPRFTQ